MLDLDAGKYAAFVWPAMAATAVVFAWMALSSLAKARRWRREADSRLRGNERDSK